MANARQFTIIFHFVGNCTAALRKKIDAVKIRAASEIAYVFDSRSRVLSENFACALARLKENRLRKTA